MGVYAEISIGLPCRQWTLKTECSCVDPGCQKTIA